MKRINFMAGFLLLMTFSVFSQDKKETAYDQFVSQSGKIIKFQDYKLPAIKGRFELFETKIRVIKAGGQTSYFFQVEKKNKYGNIIASVAETDIIEMIKALSILIENSTEDKQKSIEYLENKYVTEDGVQIGYYISGKEIGWYLVLDKYKSDATAFINDGESVLVVLKSALDKIVELKK